MPLCSKLKKQHETSFTIICHIMSWMALRWWFRNINLYETNQNPPPTCQSSSLNVMLRLAKDNMHLSLMWASSSKSVQNKLELRRTCWQRSCYDVNMLWWKWRNSKRGDKDEREIKTWSWNCKSSDKKSFNLQALRRLGWAFHCNAGAWVSLVFVK